MLLISKLKYGVNVLVRCAVKNAAASTNISELNVRVMLKYTFATKPQLCTKQVQVALAI